MQLNPHVPDEDSINRDHEFLNSSFYEQLTEHVFISEVLQEAWFRFGKRVEVLRPEIDASGFDVVFECDGILRHVQLKTSRAGGRTSRQKVNIALGDRVGGCIVWLVRRVDEERNRVAFSYRFFGGPPGEPLPPLDGFSVAKHSRGNAQGIKAKRPAIRYIPKGRFEAIAEIGTLLDRLFGLQGPPATVPTPPPPHPAPAPEAPPGHP